MALLAPPDDMIVRFLPLYRELVDRLGFISSAAPLQYTNWYRDPVHNQAVGGHPFSQHQWGFAVDVVSSNPDATVRAARQMGFVAVDEFDHVHIQIFPAGFLESVGLRT